MNALMDASLPTTDGDREVFTVEYRGDDQINGKCLHRVEYLDELDAVRTITSCGIYENLTLVGFGPNIDRSKYRH